MLKEYYLYKLGYPFIPSFLVKYLKCPSLQRLKNIGYFCGMDYASKDIYDFKEYISRFDHSLSTSLIVYNLTHDKTATVAALFHDIATPCFSHVIDYMNQDYLNQESTEEFTELIIRNDYYLKECLKVDNIDIEDIINFKQFTVVDNNRPKLCADRLDGIILTSIGWTKSITARDIKRILNNSILYHNEDNELEIGFCNNEVADLVIKNAQLIDSYCHTKEDNYMMELLASITKLAIDKEYINYEELYILDEQILFNYLYSIDYCYMQDLLERFSTIKKSEIVYDKKLETKKRVLAPICNGKRIN